jgi:hypothetical protein
MVGATIVGIADGTGIAAIAVTAATIVAIADIAADTDPLKEIKARLAQAGLFVSVAL